MKVTSDSFENNSIVLGGNSLGTATIKNSPEFFQVLSDSLYSNKILAVCREIMCNAWDSHIVNKKTDIPIEINLYNNTLSIKDFGEGIPKERMQEIYFQYGNSSKTKDVSQTGGFGLGSKAPFAYADTFTVISKNNGLETKYKLIKAGRYEDGNPELIEIYSKPTEESGLEVIIDILREDHSSFLYYIKKIAFFGNITCNFITSKDNTDSILPTINLTEKDNYIIYDKYVDTPDKGYLRKNNEEISVIVGNVIYPLNLEYFSDKIKNRLYFTFLNKGSKLIFKIFDKNITVTPSRENISYTPKTIKIISKEINKVIDKFLLNYKIFKKEIINKELLSNFTGILQERFNINGIDSIKSLNKTSKDIIHKAYLKYYLNEEKYINEKLIKNNVKFFKDIYKNIGLKKFFKKTISYRYTLKDLLKTKSVIYAKTIFLIKNSDKIDNLDITDKDFKYYNELQHLPYKFIVFKNTELYNDINKFNIIKDNLSKVGINLVKKEIKKPLCKYKVNNEDIFVKNIINNERININLLEKNSFLVNTHEITPYITDMLNKANISNETSIYIKHDYVTLSKNFLKKFKNINDLYKEIILPELKKDIYFNIAALMYFLHKKHSLACFDTTVYLYYEKYREFIYPLIFKEKFNTDIHYSCTENVLDKCSEIDPNYFSLKNMHNILKPNLNINLLSEKNIKILKKKIVMLDLCDYFKITSIDDFNKIYRALKKYIKE